MGKKKNKTKMASQLQQEKEEEITKNKNTDKSSSSKDDGKMIHEESSKGGAVKRVVNITTTITKPNVENNDSSPLVDADGKDKEGKKVTKSTTTTTTTTAKNIDAEGQQQAEETKKKHLSTTTTNSTTTTTKRQRLRQVNEKNRWIMPSPRIQTVEGRAKAAIRIAGLSSNQKQLHSTKNNTLIPTLDLHSPEVKFGRLLGSVDERVRHKAVVQLKSYLKARCAIVNNNNPSSSNDDGDQEEEESSSNKKPRLSGLSEMDLLKLWKALWYTLYMADKVPVQEALSVTIASLLWCVAGTEEEDEYAAQVYMDMCAEPYDDEDEEDDEDEDEQEDADDPDFTLEELVNTLDNKENTESDSDSSGRSDDGDENGDDEMQDSNQDGDCCARMTCNQGECDNDGEDYDDEDDMDDSEILHCRGAHLASLLIRTFFQTIRREWGRMDKYRVDKFYTLIRLVMHEVFVYMAKRHWNVGIIRLFNDAIYEQVLRETPNGLRYHVIDVTLPELAKVNANSKQCPMSLTEATLLDVLEPYFAMAQTGAGGDDSVQVRVMDNILIKFLTQYSIARTETPRDEEEYNNNNNSNQDDKNEKASSTSLVMDNVHVGTIGQFIFDVASDPETLDKYRKSLYDLHKRYVRRLQEPDVTDVNIQADNNDEEEEEENEVSSSGTKQDDMEVVEMTIAEARYDADVDTPERPARNTIKKKNKKFKAGTTLVADEEKVAAEEEKPVVLEKKNQSSKRSIEKVDSNELDHDDADEGAEADNDTTEDDAAKEKKKRKRKKRKKNEHRGAADADGVLEEEEVTISLQDQAKAKASLLAASKREQEHAAAAQHQENELYQSKEKTKKKSRKDREQNAAAAEAAARQVKFAPVNHARSWKASMKGLRTMTPKLQPSPEKGLLKKSAATKKAAKAGNRKKATDYF